MKKWKGMSDSFLKSVKKKTVPEKGASNRPYIHARQMQFLLDYGISSALATNIEKETETTIEEDGVDRVEETIVDLGIPSDRPDTPPPTCDTTAKDCPIKKTYDDGNFASIPAKTRRLIVNLLKCMNTLEPSPVREESDDDRSFFDSLLPIVKTLPMDTKLEFRYRVMGLLKELRASVDSQPPTSTTSFQQPQQATHSSSVRSSETPPTPVPRRSS